MINKHLSWKLLLDSINKMLNANLPVMLYKQSEEH